MDQILLKVFNSDPANHACADCNSKAVLWASWNLGIFICTTCSSYHRALGVHISKVKSIRLDNWSKEQVISMAQRGNSWAEKYYCENAPRDRGSDLEILIKKKYEYQMWKAANEPTLNDFEHFFQPTKPENLKKLEMKNFNILTPPKLAKRPTKTPEKSPPNQILKPRKVEQSSNSVDFAVNWEAAFSEPEKPSYTSMTSFSNC